MSLLNIGGNSTGQQRGEDDGGDNLDGEFHGEKLVQRS